MADNDSSSKREFAAIIPFTFDKDSKPMYIPFPMPYHAGIIPHVWNGVTCWVYNPKCPACQWTRAAQSITFKIDLPSFSDIIASESVSTKSTDRTECENVD